MFVWYQWGAIKRGRSGQSGICASLTSPIHQPWSKSDRYPAIGNLSMDSLTYGAYPLLVYSLWWFSHRYVFAGVNSFQSS